MKTLVPKKTPEGVCYLNAGCGDHFFLEWNNIDCVTTSGVVYHDVRKPLPYPATCFDAVYASHVLEHLTPREGERFLRELYRTLQPGGVVRIVVPDLEMICREYLKYLELMVSRPTDINLKRYEWIKLELIDQMVREKPGGRMTETVLTGNYDAEFLKARSGDSFIKSQASQNSSDMDKWAALKDKPFGTRFRIAVTVLKRRLRTKLGIPPDPRKTGEAHKWMYDRVSLKIALEKVGFVDFCVTSYDQSRIPYWEKYNLDRSVYKEASRKPDSLYVEANKPG